MKPSLKRRDYRKCEWSGRELMFALFKSTAVVLFLAYFFYRSMLAVIPLSSVGILYFRRLKRQSVEKNKQQLLFEFKECILSIATALRVGYAVENAFLESRNEMRMLFGEQSFIYRELELIRRGLVINITLEELLKDFAERSDCRDVQQFAEVFAIAKRNGGNLAEIINNTSEIINRQIEVRQEIQTLLSGRKMEQKIMKLMPFGILIYIGMTYSGYFISLYHNPQGIAVMTTCLAIYIVAYLLSDKIIESIATEMSV